jgi:hypothetical protein
MTNIVQFNKTFNMSDVSTLALDLANPKPKEVLALVETIEEYIKTNPELGPLSVTTGWNDIDPLKALDLIKRNRPGANRKIDPGTVFYYANQMAHGDWKATGQPILIDENGRLIDAQHRVLAVLISGAMITSFVVTGIKAIPNLFAYIDNSRSRTVATALQTSGLDGVSATIAQMIKLGEEIKAGVYDQTGAKSITRMSPADVLNIVNVYPNAQKAARSAASDWDEAADYIGKKRVIVAYLGMRIMDLYGEEVADDFFEDLMDTDVQRSHDHPIAALRREIDKDKRSTGKQMKKQHMLAAMIKAFNAWKTSESLGRRWMLQVNEDFPKFAEPQPAQDAA